MMTDIKERKRKKQFVEFLVLSLILHLLLVYFLFGDLLMIKYAPMLMREPIDVYVIDPELTRQIVAIDDEKGDADPNKNAKFLSKVNKKVDQETRAKFWGKPYNRKLQIVQSILEEDLDNAIGDYMKRKKNKANTNRGDKNYSEQKNSSTYDYLSDINPGDFTQLNTAEFIYYSFYRRVEDSIVYLWNRYVNDYVMSHPDVRASLSKRDYITEVEAVFDKNGNFVRTIVLRSSGVAGIDEAPGRAFAEASPFENPPNGMVENDNFVHMRWRFIVSIVEEVRFNVQEMDINPYQRMGYPDPALDRQIY